MSNNTQQLSWANRVRGSQTQETYQTPQKPKKPKENSINSNIKVKYIGINKICNSNGLDGIFAKTFYDRISNECGIVFSLKKDVNFNNNWILRNKFTIHAKYLNRSKRKPLFNNTYLSQIHFKGDDNNKKTWINIYNDGEYYYENYYKINNELTEDQLKAFKILFKSFIICMK